jgi:hypothetical protein
MVQVGQLLLKFMNTADSFQGGVLEHRLLAIIAFGGLKSWCNWSSLFLEWYFIFNSCIISYRKIYLAGSGTSIYSSWCSDLVEIHYQQQQKNGTSVSIRTARLPGRAAGI